MQSLAASSTSNPLRPKDLTMASTARYILAVDGWKGLFRGVTPRIGLSVWRVRFILALSLRGGGGRKERETDLGKVARARRPSARLARGPRQGRRQEGRRRERSSLKSVPQWWRRRGGIVSLVRSDLAEAASRLLCRTSRDCVQVFFCVSLVRKGRVG